ncbi:MAG: hypothetical protein UV68_C0035G0009 [Candidatus Collierbacteria bacterium GW2011_GWC2_43_12]|uniref:Uncharacterized protein n=1 Tax=Candidatus Collierbacteria bacterium GW2011_GWC2_43_12 TaxID=1618390 RepID=A0A0G1D507_9BACT|nr:MAG: hypothetical protein UV68_C0035G0009 [Candidatus Collierbacteria bacterium GW2011_GWC2_43_12]
MQTWEYLRVEVSLLDRIKAINGLPPTTAMYFGPFLTEKGQQGWELCGDGILVPHETIKYILKRPVGSLEEDV